jgi:hypothetical protein
VEALEPGDERDFPDRLPALGTAERALSTVEGRHIDGGFIAQVVGVGVGEGGRDFGFTD